MELLNKLFEKRKKVSPWIIPGGILVLLGSLTLIISYTCVFQANCIWALLLSLAGIIAVGSIPYVILDRIDEKISKTIADIVTVNIADLMKSKSFVLDEGAFYTIKVRRIDGAYLLKVFVHNVSADFMAFALSVSLKNLMDSLNYEPHIETTISQTL